MIPNKSDLSVLNKVTIEFGITRITLKPSEVPAMNENTSKKRLLLILQLLYKKTDEDHPASTVEIIDYLKQEGINVNRKTLANDIQLLIDMGYDIVKVKSSPNKYFWGDREFELPELKMLIDAVSSSRFISGKKSNELISKIASLAGEAQSESLNRHIIATGRAKTDNKEVYYIVDRISNAINQKKKIQFQYTEYNINKEKILRNNGEIYTLSPYVLYCNEDYYYAVGFNDKRKTVTSFRVDRIHSPEIIDEPIVPKPENFNVNDYANKIFKMFDGEETLVLLECKNELIKYLVDRYGTDFKTEKKTDTTFIASIPVALSPTFYSWVFQFAGDMRILYPQMAVKKFEEMLDNCR